MTRLFPLLFVFVSVAGLAGCKDNGTGPDTVPPANVPYAQTDIRVGTGPEAVLGRRVTVHYSLWLYSTSGTDNKGRLVQTTAGGQPVPIDLIVGRVIDGWVRGVPGMKVGGIRRLVVPPELGYGAQGFPPDIPGNATLLFEIDLVTAQ